jgi:putative methyltransferase
MRVLISRLLDPSCSGSGIVNRLDYLLAAGKHGPGPDEAISDVVEQDETDAKAERLEKLAFFQLQMILHAFKCKSHLVSLVLTM